MIIKVRVKFSLFTPLRYMGRGEWGRYISPHS